MGSQHDKTIFDLLDRRSRNKRERTGTYLLTKTSANYFAARTDQTEIAKRAEVAREALRSIDRILDEALAQTAPEVQVPRLAETILMYLYPPELIEGMLGDLEEGFRRMKTQRGLAAARWWYHWQTARSIVTFAASSLYRLVSILEVLRKLGL
jgi:hypothetical protein